MTYYLKGIMFPTFEYVKSLTDKVKSCFDFVEYVASFVNLLTCESV